MGIKTGNFPLIEAHLGLNTNRDGNKKLSLSPAVTGCPSKKISLQLHFAIRQLSKSSWREHQMIGPQYLSEALPVPTIKWLLISKKANALWLYDCFPSHSQSLFSHLSAPLNTNHPGRSRRICLLRISEGQHLRSGIIILVPLLAKTSFSEMRFVLSEHQLLFLFSNANKDSLHVFKLPVTYQTRVESKLAWTSTKNTTSLKCFFFLLYLFVCDKWKNK